MRNAFPELWPADIVGVRTDGRCGRLIRATGVLMSGDCRVNHIAGSLGALSPVPEVLESRWRIKRTPLSAYAGTPVVVWRNVYLTDGERRRIALKAMECFGRWYAPLKLPLFAADAVATMLRRGRRTTWFTEGLGQLPWFVCSQYWGWAYDTVLRRQMFGAPWQSLAPDDIDDFCRHCTAWQCLYSSIPN